MMPLNETLNIDTPENVTFDYDIAGVGSRFAAALIDTAVIVVLQVVTNLLVLLILSRSGVGGEMKDLRSVDAWVIALVGLISFLFLWGYYIFFEMLWNGQTPGKKAIRLRVIRTDGTPITLTETMIRNLVRLIDFLPAFYGIGTVTIFINRQTRRLGDLAAGTLVVREKNQQVTLKDLAALHHVAGVPVSPANSIDQPVRDYPVELLNYQDIQMIENFFQRQGELVNWGDLARQLLVRLLNKMAIDAPVSSPAGDEAILKKILSEYRQRHQ